jgi:transporter family protein
MDWRMLTAITVVCWGGYSLILKKASGQIAWQASMFLFVLGYAILVGLYYLLDSGGTFPTLLQKKSIWPFLAGILCAVGGVTFFRAIAMAPGSVFLPLVSLSMIISGIGCLIFFREPVTTRLVVGTIFAAIAVVLLAK